MSFYSERIFPWLCAQAVKHYDEQRQAVVSNAGGRVLELGVGVGSNFAFYRHGVEEVVGIDPSPAMLRISKKRAEKIRQNNGRGPAFTLVEGSAAKLDFEDNSFDTVVSFLVFCSIDQPLQAADEVYRVLKPGGKLLIFEHVAADSARLRKWQTRLNPLWTKVAGGCNLNRDTLVFFKNAGFQVAAVETCRHPEALDVVSPKIQGVAIKLA